MILDFIKELDCIDNELSFNKYKRYVNALLKKYGYEFIGSGSYCDVYSNKKSHYVIKITKKQNCTFFTVDEYVEHKDYLAPRYVSKNKFVAVQRKAITHESINKELAELDKSVSESIKKIKLEASARKEKLNSMSSKLRIGNLHSIVSDLHNGNIGLFNDRVMMIDLNNQFDRL